MTVMAPPQGSTAPGMALHALYYHKKPAQKVKSTVVLHPTAAAYQTTHVALVNPPLALLGWSVRLMEAFVHVQTGISSVVRVVLRPALQLIHAVLVMQLHVQLDGNALQPASNASVQ